MKEHVNLLSKATIPRGYIRKYNMYNNKHVLYWDYDNSELPVEELKKVVDKHGLHLHIIKTLHGFHLVDFQLRDFFEILAIQKDFKKVVPSDYPTIQEVKDLDNRDKQEFEGQTLRITKKDVTPGVDLVYVTSIKASKLSDYRPYSTGHVYIYGLVLGKFDEEGTPLKTNISVCSFLNKKEQELVV